LSVGDGPAKKNPAKEYHQATNAQCSKQATGF
jgi:hypothetical protein